MSPKWKPMPVHGTLAVLSLAALLALPGPGGAVADDLQKDGATKAPPAPAQGGKPATEKAAAPGTSTPAEAAPLPASTHWYRDSAEMRACYLQSYGLATRIVESASKAEKPGTWAVVLDVDETVLDNSTYQKETGSHYKDATWQAWCRREEAAALPGAKPFLDRVHELGGKVVLVTNRDDVLKQSTESNLKKVAIAFDEILPSTGTSDKNPRFKAVETGTPPSTLPPLKVLLFVGDNIQDFPGWRQKEAIKKADTDYAAFGEKFIVLPNPMYGSWGSNPAR